MALRRSLRAEGGAGSAPACLALLAALVAACSHGDRFSAPPADPNPPRNVLGMQQLTVGGAGDWAPAWLGTGTTIGFSWRDPMHDDHDRCVAIMPLAVRRITRALCQGGHDARDSTNAVFSQAFSPGGQVAYVQAEGPIAHMASARLLVVRPADGSGYPVTAVSFPRTMNNGNLHQGAVDLAWTSESTLVYIGTRIVYVTGVPEATDTTESGIELVRLAVNQNGGTPVVVPNTDSILTVTVDPATHIAYALFLNHPDTVFTLDLVTGQRALALDLTALAPVRYLSARGGRLVMVVGGGSLHRSGNLAYVDLPGGAPVLLPQVTTDILHGYYFGRPALSPARDAIVAEAFAYAYVQTSPLAPRDTIVNHASDLYLVAVP